METSRVNLHANLTAPAVHLHDETAVPMTATYDPIQTDFRGDEADMVWVTTYTCPQCDTKIGVDSMVSLRVRATPPAEVSWFHGSPPPKTYDPAVDDIPWARDNGQQQR
jgi:hypothetical protein